MHAIHPSIQNGGAMERPGNPGNRPQSIATAGTTSPPAGSATVTDEITLSPEAKAFIESNGPGKSGNSPANRARAIMAEGFAPAGMSFGKVVSSLAQGATFEAPPPPVDDSGDTPAGDIAPPDGIDPIAPVVEEGVAPIDQAATEGEVLPATTDGAIPVAVTTSELGDFFPDIDPNSDAEREASLLETLSTAIDDATDENPDGGIDIAA